MFRKPIKIKSNTPVKGSERKLIREKIKKQFPILTEEDLNNLLPKKESLNFIKIITSSEEIVQVYTIQKKPICFELNGKVFPALYLLWQFPNLIHNFTINKHVLTFLNSGADLMLPGVFTPPPHTNLTKYGNVQEGDIVAVNLSTNKASIAVGIAAMSSYAMENSAGRGKCVTIIHVQGDKLSLIENLSNSPCPDLGPPDWLKLQSYEEDFPALGSAPVQKFDKTIVNSELKPVDNGDSENNIEKEVENNCNDELVTLTENLEISTEEWDDILFTCFVTAIKYSKTLTLPILTSNFYKLHLLAACPPDKSLDIKKTSYKKLKPFLDKMCKDNMITIKEIKKGVESVTAINTNHPKFEMFYLKPEDRPSNKNESNSNNTSNIPSITESYVITQSVLPIFNFEETKYQKGDTVLGTTVKKQIREYVVFHNCQHQNPKLVQLDSTLSNICKNTNAIAWEELYEKVCSSMKSCFKVQNGLEEILNKGKVSPITINVANRSGNKKVTLIDNLHLYGIKISEFAKECQHGVAASTSISTPPGHKGEQLLVQGNQVLFVHNLLLEKYKIPKRYIRGLENAPKRKK